LPPSCGAPVEAAERVNAAGSFSRDFRNGSAIFDPPGNSPVSVAFKAPVTRRSTGEVGRRFVVPAGDGDIFIRK